MKLRSLHRSILLSVLALSLAGCNWWHHRHPVPVYPIGGSVGNLNGTLVLSLNATEQKTLSSSGAFSFTTLIASGSPYGVTIVTQPTGQTCAFAGSASGTVTGPVTVTINCVTSTYSVGGTISGLTASGLMLLDNGQDQQTVSANATTYGFPTQIAYGSNYAVTISSQPAGLICTPGANAAGQVTGAVSVAISCVANTTQGYAYATSNNGSTVSQYSIGAGGVLAPLTPATVVAAGNPKSIAINPAGQYVYVPDLNGSVVWEYTVGADGTLSPMNPASVTTGPNPSDANPEGITVDPSGRYVYVATSGGAIAQYTIGAGGVLTPMATPYFNTGGQLTGITVDPSTLYAYATDHFNGAILQYTIGAGGALTPMAPASVPASGNPQVAPTVDPSGHYLYLADYGANILQYTIGGGGTLTPMNPASVPTTGNANPWAVAVDPTGHYAYATGTVVSQYTVGAGGALTPMNPATVAAGTQPAGISFDPTGKYVYVTNLGGNISLYMISPTGTLTPLTPPSVTTGARAYQIVTAP